MKDKKGIENQFANHLSRLEKEDMLKLGDGAKTNDAFPDDRYWRLLMIIFLGSHTWITTRQVIWFYQICLFTKGNFLCMI